MAVSTGSKAVELAEGLVSTEKGAFLGGCRAISRSVKLGKIGDIFRVNISNE